MHRKTMVHVPELLGCMANGPTTEAALEATPEAIRAYLRFMKRCGETVDTEALITTRVEEHITEGAWLGNGDPGIVFGADLVPVSAQEVETFLGRLHGLRRELASWGARSEE